MSLDQILAELRSRIDGIDEKLVALLDERARTVREIGQAKREAGAGFYVPSRERQILERLAERSEKVFPEEALRTVFREIISACLALEQPLTVAYLGPEGTFSHQAAKEHFGLGARLLPSLTLHDVFDQVERGHAAYAVVPIENTTEGVVGETLDELWRTPLSVVAERVVEVSHNLLNRSGRLEDVEKIFSHPQPAAQCRGWLQQHLKSLPVIEVASTAMAARLAAEDSAAAAIASEVAARIYELRVVRGRIEDHASNFTRFLVMAQAPVDRTGADKTSVMLVAEHKPGGLFQILEPFARAGVNLAKIESRPMRDRPFEYTFFVDLEGHAGDEPLAAVLDEVRGRSAFLKFLGSYPRADTPTAP